MKRIAVGLIFAMLVGILLAIPANATAGDYGCNSRYYQPSYYNSGYSTPAYYTPRYSYPAGYYPQTYSNTPYVPVTPYVPPGTCVDTPNGTVCNQVQPFAVPTPIVSSTLYNVAPDLANARIAQEAAAQAINGLKAEFAKQQEQAKAEAKEQRQVEFQNQVLQLLARNQQTAPLAYPAAPLAYPAAPLVPQLPAMSPAEMDRLMRLEADNANMRAVLQRIASTPPAPTAPATGAPPIPPGSPPGAGSGTPVGSATKGQLLEQVRAVAASNCMPCHGANKAPRVDLTDPAKLTYNLLSDCVNRMISDDNTFRMPRDKPQVSLADVSAFQRLSVAVK